MTCQATTRPGTILLLMLWLVAAAAHAEPARTVEVLLEDAARLLALQAMEAYPGARVEAEMQALDPRLDLPPCDDAELTPRSHQQHGRIPVAVRCQTPQPWSIFLTGDVTVSVPVVITTRPVRRGEIIRPGMVATREQDLTGLRSHFYTDPTDVIGKEARRNLGESEVVVASQLTEPVAVERGSKVQIVARRGAVVITSTGEALGEGRIGAQVRVRNLGSGRIVRGWVAGPGRVVTTPGAAAARSEAGAR